MMKKKKNRSLSGMGIGAIIVLGIIMIIHFYNKFPEDPFYLRLIEGAWRFGLSVFGSGLVFLVLFLAFYFAIKISEEVFVQDDNNKEDLMDYFMKLLNPIIVIVFLVSYAIVFFEL